MRREWMKNKYLKIVAENFQKIIVRHAKRRRKNV